MAANRKSGSEMERTPPRGNDGYEECHACDRTLDVKAVHVVGEEDPIGIWCRICRKDARECSS